MQWSFTKMHGCGNDYIYFNCLEHELKEPEQVSIRLSDRHFGIGGDGIVLICSSSVADAKMRMFNADGSEGRMCGNAIRCVGKYLFDRGLVTDEVITIETLSGIKTLRLAVENSKVEQVQVDMGAANFAPKSIPVNFDGGEMVQQPITVLGKTYEGTCISMGNPHCVIFTQEVDDLPLGEIGPAFEHHELFPQQVNTEFVEKIDAHTVKMRVWERGSGETWACGTGACAVAAACVRVGITPMGEPLTVKLRGGDLTICVTAERVLMTGPATEVFSGTVLL